MDLGVRAVVIGAVIIFAVASALVTFLVARRRRNEHNRVATSKRLADLHTSYDSLKEAMLAMEAGDYAAALDMGEQVIAESALSPFAQTVAHLVVGEAASRVGAHRTATAHLPQAIEAARRGSLVAPLSELLRMQARARAELCEFDDAVALATQATQAARVSSDKAASLALEAAIHLTTGDLQAAQVSLDAASRAASVDTDRAVVDHLAGRLLSATGDLEGAAARLKTAQARYERWSDANAAAWVMLDLAEVSERLGDSARAQSLVRSALARIEERGYDRPALAIAHAKASGVEAGSGNLPGAKTHLETARRLFTVTELPSAEAYLAWAEARIAATEGNPDAASAALWRAEEAATRLGMGQWRDKVERERTGNTAAGA